ncbi:hypothetical protein O181_029969 [Austropuccinia psidii MF-1]|uniref:MICOS complex subunit n=1 Tax=Austropuccinia psidii MF-1 TaxID=1389203 RepID=A0A9Q3H535_9BASI|nr:hypothetical protein [Austropuccinia psidii MF-1]
MDAVMSCQHISRLISQVMRRGFWSPIINTMASISSTDSSSQRYATPKLPIYDEPPREIILVKTELPLQPQVRWVREHLQSFKKEFQNRAGFLMERGFKAEKDFTGTLTGLLDHKETSSSSLLCVGIGTMSGSIITRNRSLPLRFLSPLAFFIVSSYHFLPITSQNFQSYLFRLQDKHFPRSAAARDDVIRQSIESVQWFRRLKDQMLQQSDKLVRNGNQAIEKYSGLKMSHEKTNVKPE